MGGRRLCSWRYSTLGVGEGGADGGTAGAEREGVSRAEGVKTERFVMGVLKEVAFVDSSFSSLNAEQTFEMSWSDLMRNGRDTFTEGSQTPL